MKQIIGVMVWVLTFILLSCKKEKIPTLSLPGITQTGENTLGFLIDSKVWTNYGTRCTFYGCNENNLEAYLIRQPNGDIDFDLFAEYTVRSRAIDQAFNIKATNLLTPGTFMLDSNLNRGMRFIADRYTQSYKSYQVKDPARCTLTITKIDTTNHIISGSFNGVLFNPSDVNDSVTIEDGRFDTRLTFRP